MPGINFGKGPPEGGPAELIEHRRSGFTTSAYMLDIVQQHIENLASDRSLYQAFSENARERAANFGEEQTTFQWIQLIEDVFAREKASSSSKFRCPELI